MATSSVSARQSPYPSRAFPDGHFKHSMAERVFGLDLFNRPLGQAKRVRPEARSGSGGQATDPARAVHRHVLWTGGLSTAGASRLRSGWVEWPARRLCRWANHLGSLHEPPQSQDCGRLAYEVYSTHCKGNA
jgi:hypothetical protein